MKSLPWQSNGLPFRPMGGNGRTSGWLRDLGLSSALKCTGGPIERTNKVFAGLFQKAVGLGAKPPRTFRRKRSGRERGQSGGLFPRGKPYQGVSQKRELNQNA